MSRLFAVGAALSAAALPISAIAATATVNYAAIVRANEKAVSEIAAIKSGCGSSSSAQVACQKQVDKIIKSVQYRISTVTAKDAALLPAVQRATAKQLSQIFSTSLNCPSGSAAVCGKQNSKTYASLVYRITNQTPISPT